MAGRETLADIVRETAAAWPDRKAVVSGAARATYAEIDAAASRVASGLLAAGCAPQERVGILARNSLAFIEILLGCLKAGLVALPLNWRLAAPEIAYIVRHAGARVLFCAEEFRAAAEGSAERLIVIEEGAAGPHGYAAWRDGQSGVDPLAEANPADVALQMYTSGTTGLPKGVQLTHEGYGFALDSVRGFPWGRLGPEDVVLTPAPFFHVNGVNPVLRTFAAGACVVAPPQFDPGKMLALIEEHRVTRATLAPAMIQACLESPELAARDLSSLQVISYGGSPISERVLAEARRRIGCEFVQMYGLTETTGTVVALPPEDHDPNGSPRMRAAGKALPGCELAILDAEGKPVPVGEIGEIAIRGPSVMKGYWNLPDATAAAMPGDGWFKSGDAGYMDADGYLYVHDRMKDMIITGAENVYPAEVENAILGCPGVADAAVIGVPDDRWGEAVKAVVVLRPGASVEAEELIALVKEAKGSVHAPKSVDFVDEIPVSPLGKADKKALRARYWAGTDRNVH